ncbi:hypothetical protein MVEG_08298 [Podila verticillata NRRL 6337]|nr:hypothetical protein MVEG_08298 [Podila verticillata NRRL 6337]
MTPFQTLLQEQQKDRARPPTTTTVSMHRYLSKEEEGTHKSTPSPQAHHHHNSNNQILHPLSSSSSSSSSTLEESEYHALSSPTVINTPLPFQYSSSNTSPTMTPDEHYPSSETSTHLHPYSNNNNGSTATGNHNNNHNITPNKNNNYNNNNNNNNNNSSSSSNSNIKSEARPFMILANDLDRSPRIAPPPIRTKWSDDLKKREYPLTFSSSTQSSNSDRPSPSTPRSLLPLLPPLDPSLLPSSTSLHPPHRSYFAGPFDSPSKASFHRHHILPTPMYFSESPMEYRSTPLVTPPLAPPPQLQPPLQQQQQQQPQPQHHHQYQHYNHRLHEQPYLEEHDMEHCSEQDDVREREYGEDDEDEDDDDKELELRRQQHRVAQQQQHQQQQQLRYPTPNEQVQHHGEEEEGEDEEEDARSKQAKKKRPNARTHHSQSSVSSVVSDQALGVHTLRQEGKEDVKASLSKASPSPSSRQVSTKAKASTSVQGTLENVLDQIEDDNQGHDGSGVHSQAGRGLRFYSQRVCDRVQAKGATTYNEVKNNYQPTTEHDMTCLFRFKAVAVFLCRPNFRSPSCN